MQRRLERGGSAVDSRAPACARTCSSGHRGGRGDGAFFFVLAAADGNGVRRLPSPTCCYRQATTACLTAIVVMQVVNVLLCRGRRTSPCLDRASETDSLWPASPPKSLLLAIDYTAVGNAVFGTAPIGYEAWLVVMPFAGAMLLAEKARRALRAE